LTLDGDTDRAASHEHPEAAFDRAWAMAVVQGTMRELRQEYARKGRASLFEVLAPRLTATAPVASDVDGDQSRAGMSPEAFKVALHRARRRFGQLLRSRVAETVDPPSPTIIADELRELTKLLVDTAWAGATEPG